MIEEILKRLELTKIAISLKDQSVVELQISQLKLFAINDLDDIIVSLTKHQYDDARELIDNYIYRSRSQKNIEWYVVSFIDILGQNNELAGLNNEDLTDNEAKKIIDATYGNIKKLRKNIKDAFYDLEEHMDKGVYLDSNDIKIDAFSDLVVSYVSLRDDVKKIPMIGIYRLLLANSRAFLIMLSNKISLRGAIDIGRGIEHKLNGHGELYGSALSNPYYLESKVARYPRMVIGKRLHDHIYNSANITDSSKLRKENIRFAKECLSFIEKDADGEYILNYIGVSLRHLANFNEIYFLAKIFINESLIKFNNEHKLEEYQKYKSLQKYFDSKDIK